MAVIIIVILLVEVVIYLPSVANFRVSWLNDKLATGAVAARVLDVVPDAMNLPEGLADRLLDSSGALAIVYRRDGQSQLIAHSAINMPSSVISADMRKQNPFTMISGALETLFLGSNRVQRIIGIVQGQGQENAIIEVLVSEQPLRKAMFGYSKNILILSLIVAFIPSLIIFLFINKVFIAPINYLTNNMIAYRKAPENAALIIEKTRRKDEIGIAITELAAMETDLYSMLKQRRHLADLGMAVAKINHDLRNMLASVQMLSDQVAILDDPKVQHLAPRLVHSLDKAINFAQSVIEHGQQNSTPPKLQPVDLAALVNESAIDAGVYSHTDIKYKNLVPDDIILKVDPEQMSRIMVNLIKNATQALEASGIRSKKPEIKVEYEERKGGGLAIMISDNGPGLPPRAKQNLFVAFEGSARAGGVGLGLTIARELSEAHGGKLEYIELEKGTRFDICLPLSSIF